MFFISLQPHLCFPASSLFFFMKAALFIQFSTQYNVLLVFWSFIGVIFNLHSLFIWPTTTTTTTTTILIALVSRENTHRTKQRIPLQTTTSLRPERNALVSYRCELRSERRVIFCLSKRISSITLLLSRSPLKKYMRALILLSLSLALSMSLSCEKILSKLLLPIKLFGLQFRKRN